MEQSPEVRRIHELIARSSLGTPGARRVRARTPDAVVAGILAGAGIAAAWVGSAATHRRDQEGISALAAGAALGGALALVFGFQARSDDQNHSNLKGGEN